MTLAEVTDQDIMELEIDWRDLYRIPIIVVMAPLQATFYLLGFVLGVIADAYSDGWDQAEVLRLR